MSPLIGPRLSCGFCADFNLCAACHARGGARLHDASHPWWLTPAPGAPRVHVPAPGPPVHEGTACDGCGAAPIVGVRWKCAVCEDVDLCAGCEARNTAVSTYGVVHAPSHPLLKLALLGQAPVAVRAVLGADGCGSDGSPWRGGRRILRAALAEQMGFSGGGWRAQAPAARPPDEGGGGDAQAALAALAAHAAARGAGQASEPAPASDASSAAPYQGLSARFVAHLLPHAGAGPGGACVRPGAQLVRAWRVINGGVRAWPPGTALVYVGCRPEGAWGGGRAEPAAGGVPVPCAAPGAFVDIAVPVTAPALPGRYVAFFRLQAPGVCAGGGLRFGHQLRADFLVESDAPP